MIRFFYILLISSIFVACSSNTVKKNEILNNEKFIEVLKDFHKAEGVISIEKLNRSKNKNSDTISLYNFILKKHNISRIDFDNTVNYYSTNTEEYMVFYDSIISFYEKEKLQLEDSIKHEKESMTPKKLFGTKNLWKKKQEWIFNKLPKDKAFNFNIKTEYSGEYILKFNLFTSPKIKNFSERVKLIANYTDGTSDSSNKITVKKYYKNPKYDNIKNSIITNKDKELKSISGWLIDYQKGERRHFHFNDIEINYVYKEQNSTNNRDIDKQK